MAIGMVLALWKVGCIRRVSESSRRRYSQRHHHERVKLMSEDENEVDIETREVELYSLGH